MTRRTIAIILGTVALIGAAVLAWNWFFDQKARVRRTIEAAAAALEIKEGESAAAGLAKVHKLEQLLDDSIDVRIRFNRQTYVGKHDRRDAMTGLAALRRAGVKLKVKLSDFNIAVDGDTAHAEAAATIEGRNGNQDISLQEDVEFDLVRRNGEWLISRIAIRNFMEK